MNKEDLIIGKWYEGLSRFQGGIGIWNGTCFMGFGNKFGLYVEITMDYYPEIDYILHETTRNRSNSKGS